MASDFLSGNGPLDLILDIIDACETLSDAVALTSTCRAMFHSMGRAYVVSRLWSELLDSIPCFEEALVAVSYGHS
jgi:hypothetical protein